MKLAIFALSTVTLGAACTIGCGEYIKCAGSKCGSGGGSTIVVGDEATQAACESATRLDHSTLAGLLAQHTHPSTDGKYVYLDYDTIASSPDGKIALDQYIACLSFVVPEQLTDVAQRRAFWFNVYNATVIRGILEAYAGDRSYSVQENNFAFFKVESHRYAGVDDLSLDQIEHVIIRGDETHDAAVDLQNRDPDKRAALFAQHELLWPNGETIDARIHVALNCAARGCPNLGSTAFSAASLEAQLDDAARAFANNDAKGAGPNGVSSLFDWFEPDWTASYGGPSDFIAQYRDGGSSGVDFSTFIPYDWSLNITPSP